MGKRGRKSVRGQPETDWGEPKSAKLTINLTWTGKEGLFKLAKSFGVSVAELLERLSRGLPIEESPAQIPHPTIAELVGARELEELARKSQVRLEDLVAIANGGYPESSVLIRLAQVLKKTKTEYWTPEELQQIRYRTFNSNSEHQSKGPAK